MRNTISTASSFALWVGLAAGAVAEPATAAPSYEVKSGSLAVSLDQNARMTGLHTRTGAESWLVSGGTALAGMQVKSAAAPVALSGGGWKFTRTLTDSNGHHATLTDSFTPDQDGIRWELAITSPDATPWTTNIVSSLHWAKPEARRLWLAWGSPDGSGTASLRKGNAKDVLNGAAFMQGAWTDPLVPAPFAKRAWDYGATRTGAPFSPDFASLPLISVLNPENDRGVTLALSPENPMIRVKFSVTPAGEMQCVHSCYRLGGGKTLKLTQHLVAHEASWRGGLRFLTTRYPQFFDPPNPKAHDIGGGGAYSSFEGKIDAAKLKKMAFGFIWKMCDDCPYFGMFIPPVKDKDEKWTRNGKEPTADKPVGSQASCRQLNDFAKYIKESGFCYLSYFDVTEFGQDMRGRKPVRAKDDPELWKDPAAYMAYHLPHAVLPPTTYSAYALPVTFAGNAATATVTVRNLPGLEKLKAEALLPAIEQPQAVKTQFKDGVLELTVPLKNGCAMLRLRQAK